VQNNVCTSARDGPLRHNSPTSVPPRGGLQLADVLEPPQFDLTVFKVHYGNLTPKVYSASSASKPSFTTHTILAVVAESHASPKSSLASRTCSNASSRRRIALTSPFVSDETLDQLPLPSILGKTRVGGLDLNKVRIRTVLAGVLAFASSPTGFRVSDLTAKISNMSTHMERGLHTSPGLV
jgi:hypothetical protein